MKRSIKFLAAAAVLGCSAIVTAQESIDSNGLDPEYVPEAIELSKEAVREKLKDPDSANFRSFSIHRGEEPTDGAFYICGEVNAKNSYGGYAGFERFLVLFFYYPERKVGFAGTTVLWNNDGDQQAMADLYYARCVN
jgi:hypothetical protein